jgi:hypothetical protein
VWSRAEGPALAVLRREGDPRPAVGVAVAVNGPPGATEALAALVEARLGEKPGAAVAADRRALRARAPVESEAEIVPVLRALRRALDRPVRPEELAAVLERLRARRGYVVDDEAAAALARCTGEARYTAAEFATVEASLASTRGLEAWRRQSVGASTVAFALVGPERFARRAERHLRAEPRWPSGPRPAGPPAAGLVDEALVRSARTDVPRVEVARWFGERRVAASIAEELGANPSSLVTRLRALPLAFALREVNVGVGTAGACVSLGAEAERAAGAAAGVAVASAPSTADDAGAAAGLLRHELGALEANAPPDDRAPGRQIAALGDAGTAAEAAAWWALSADGRGRGAATTSVLTLPLADSGRAASLAGAPAERTSSGPDVAPGRTLGASPEGPGAKAGASPEGPVARPGGVLDAPGAKAPGASDLTPPGASASSAEVHRELERRFGEASARALAAWGRPVVDVRASVEPGQGEAWVLLASPCPPSESASDAGSTALGATAAALGAPRDGGVRVEPWVSSEGAGVLAHAPFGPGETATALAARVAEAAARALLEREPGADEVGRARALLLANVEARDEHVRGAVAEQLLPSHAGAWFPWGLAAPLGRASAEGVRGRWRRLANGPLRMAVLAGGGPEQVRAAARAVERWAARGEGAERCPPREPLAEALGGRREAIVIGARGARAYVTVPVDASTADARAALGATLALLAPEGGVLARALGGLGARGEAFLLGSEPRPQLAVELRGSDEALEGAVAQVRALFDRLRRGAVGPGDLARVRGLLREAWLAARSSPRRRLTDAWRGRAEAPVVPPLEAWRAWLASGFFDERAAVVVVKGQGA